MIPNPEYESVGHLSERIEMATLNEDEADDLLAVRRKQRYAGRKSRWWRLQNKRGTTEDAAWWIRLMGGNQREFGYRGGPRQMRENWAQLLVDPEVYRQSRHLGSFGSRQTMGTKAVWIYRVWDMALRQSSSTAHRPLKAIENPKRYDPSANFMRDVEDAKAILNAGGDKAKSFKLALLIIGDKRPKFGAAVLPILRSELAGVKLPKEVENPPEGPGVVKAILPYLDPDAQKDVSRMGIRLARMGESMLAERIAHAREQMNEGGMALLEGSIPGYVKDRMTKIHGRYLSLGEKMAREYGPLMQLSQKVERDSDLSPAMRTTLAREIKGVADAVNRASQEVLQVQYNARTIYDIRY